MQDRADDTLKRDRNTGAGRFKVSPTHRLSDGQIKSVHQ